MVQMLVLLSSVLRDLVIISCFSMSMIDYPGQVRCNLIAFSHIMLICQVPFQTRTRRGHLSMAREGEIRFIRRRFLVARSMKVCEGLYRFDNA